MIAVSKNVYFDVLNDIVDKYNNTYRTTIKMNPTDVKSNYYAEYNVDSNDNYPKFKIDDHVRNSKHKNKFAKGYSSNWLKEKAKLKILHHGLMLLMILMVKKLLEGSMRKNCKKQIKKNLEQKK